MTALSLKYKHTRKHNVHYTHLGSEGFHLLVRYLQRTESLQFAFRGAVLLFLIQPIGGDDVLKPLQAAKRERKEDP